MQTAFGQNEPARRKVIGWKSGVSALRPRIVGVESATDILSKPEKASKLITFIKSLTVRAWSFVFDHRVSPLRHIPDVAVRHYVLQALGLMWAVCFSVAIGSYTFLAASIVGHSVLIAAAAVTVTTFTVAAKRPKFFVSASGRRSDGEHD